MLGKEPAVEGLHPLFDGFPVKILRKGPAGQGEDLGGGKAIAEHMIQEIVMERIGAHQVLGILGDLALLVRGQELRADGGIQNVQQHLPGRGKVRVLRNGLDHPADQRLGNGGVDAVHAHLVAVIGAPAQGQLGKVSGAHNDAPYPAGIVHQDLRPFPGLGIFEGPVELGGIMSDIPEVLEDSILDGDLLCLDAQGVHQLPGIGMGAVRGAEAGHGDAIDIRSRTAHLVHRLHSHQKSQGGIQAAGYADDRIGPDGGKPLLQARHLDIEDGHTPLQAVSLVRGHKGQLVGAAKGSIRPQGSAAAIDGAHGLQIAIEGGGVLDALIPAALSAHPAQVSVIEEHIVCRQLILALGQDGSVLRKHTVAGKHQVLGGLGAAGRAIAIDTIAHGGLMLHKASAVFPLADGFIGGRQVHDDLRPIQRLQGGGRQRRPQVLADLHAQQGPVTDAEDQVPSHGILPVSRQAQLPGTDGPALQVPGGGEPAALIKFIIIGQIGFGYDAVEPSPGDDHAAIVHLSLNDHGATHYGGDIWVPGGAGQNLLDPLQAGLQ